MSKQLYYVKVLIGDNDEELFEGVTTLSREEIEKIIISKINLAELEIEQHVYLKDDLTSLSQINDYCDEHCQYFSFVFYPIQEYS